jgi:hypothetical protein
MNCHSSEAAGQVQCDYVSCPHYNAAPSTVEQRHRARLSAIRPNRTPAQVRFGRPLEKIYRLRVALYSYYRKAEPKPVTAGCLISDMIGSHSTLEDASQHDITRLLQDWVKAIKAHSSSLCSFPPPENCCFR